MSRAKSSEKMNCLMGVPETPEHHIFALLLGQVTPVPTAVKVRYVWPCPHKFWGFARCLHNTGIITSVGLCNYPTYINYSLPLLGWFYPNYRRKSKFMIISYIGIHWSERKSKTHNHNQPSLGNTHCFFPNTNVFLGKKSIDSLRRATCGWARGWRDRPGRWSCRGVHRRWSESRRWTEQPYCSL